MAMIELNERTERRNAWICTSRYNQKYTHSSNFQLHNSINMYEETYILSMSERNAYDKIDIPSIIHVFHTPRYAAIIFDIHMNH